MGKILKGALVRLDVAKCFTVDEGGERRYPLANYHYDELGVVRSARPITPEERDEWRVRQREAIADAIKNGEDPSYIARDDAGESRLPPRSVEVMLHRDRVYTVLRARARVSLGWGNPEGGYCKILCTETGQETYVKRGLIEVV